MGRDSAAGKVKLKKFLEEIDAGMTELFMVRMVLEILVPRLQSLVNWSEKRKKKKIRRRLLFGCGGSRG
ncbi:hypothetical protein L915_07660 [Phytophthora nicotianae]|uniref:Uncharacterized protein n=1 Tax=Phytophthora nicotianae TaxID=4792 RepID=W2NGV7_PHYNI|nr:hypothetical protein L915_07660 [Phytophthora nicotianae]ETL41435.1 hypothetical protein L916_07589 [Phytophthora nicotianae]ETM47821.1 hypothetical protein L914_07555 [Phytophthora nicotianae]